MKKVKEKKDIGTAATGSILNTVAAMSTFSSTGSNRSRHDNTEKIKSSNTHRVRPNKCSVCDSESQIGNHNKENSFQKNMIESKYDPSESSFKSIIPPPPPPPQVLNTSHVSTICEQVTFNVFKCCKFLLSAFNLNI